MLQFKVARRIIKIMKDHTLVLIIIEYMFHSIYGYLIRNMQWLFYSTGCHEAVVRTIISAYRKERNLVYFHLKMSECQI